MESVKTVGAVTFINYSKATNAEAAAKSLSSYDNIFWICGGVAKAGGISELQPLFDRVAHAYLIGECADEFAKTLDGGVPHSLSGTLDAAVKAAYAKAAKCGGDAVVLLAPAAASFDQFKSFEARGDAFKDLVQAEDFSA
jgi:UDP-N-acetylmuramoylalanine--D-glutamate ligase